MKIQIPDSLIRINEMSKYPIYVVGGYVRNSFAHFEQQKTDIDVAGPAIADALGLSKRFTTKVVNHKLGTAIIKYNDDEYEYTPFRLEKYASDGSHSPIEVKFTQDIKADAMRRDFTCNAIYYDITHDEIIDPLHGLEDIERKILRAHNPERIFASDGLRILRMVRIAAETGFKIDGATALAAKKNAELLRDISAERRRIELEKILVADTKYGVANAHYRGLKLLNQLGLFKYLIPQLEDGAGLAQNPKYHKYDVLEHTFRTVQACPPEVRLAALLHDVGKPYCANRYGNMHGHETVSAHIVKYTLGEYGLKFSNSVIEETEWLCANHMYDRDGKTKIGKLKIFVAKNFDRIDKLVALIKADRIATGMPSENDGGERLLAIKQELIDTNAPLKVTDLAIDGGTMILEGIQPTNIGKLLNELWTNCVVNPSLNNTEWLLEQIRKNNSN